MMTYIKDLKPGDRILTEEGNVAVITSCRRSALFQGAPGTGGAFDLEYKDGEETGRALASGLDQVQNA